MAVVDASILVRALVRTEGSAAAVEWIEGHPLSAPDIILVETANALWRYVQAGRKDCDMARLLLKEAPLVIDRIVPSVELLDSAIAIACDAQHPVYDCLYLALAGAEQAVLGTADRKLASIAQSRGVATELIA
ncbi:type II toxin-antitoxin system VapC family toxin [Kaistia sp. MMO-174]|uniref:type II toxin-antitoxin system VapC family toxin n=1 Tax=Kaistia sp. MMO-174 TaxID=3081256 RepID=UPI0030176FB7